jgi:hypothetical protein
VHRGYVPIDAALLRQLYVGDTLSTDKIAARLGCTATTIRRRLRRFGIEIRPRGPVSLMRSRPVALTSATAYAVGLAATDGNLSSDRRHMSFVSKDQDLVETFRQCLRLTTPMRTLRTRLGTAVYRVQWCDRRLYDWFLALGLMPAKSLRLGGLAIPDEFLADFFRGCIDGDGTIRVYTDSYHRRKKDRYVYERLYVSLVSASRPFVEWIQTAVNRVAHVSGSIQESKRQGAQPIWELRYAKAESIRLIRWMYHSPDVPCLDRKREKAERFLSPLGYISVRPVGRPRVGWLYNDDAAR